jgi:ribonuclease J
VDLFSMTELIDLAPKEGAYIFSKTEPFNDEMDIDRRRLGNWIDRFGLRMVKAHASGHASRAELEEMIDAVGPRRIVPVHTLNAKAFADRFGAVVSRPTPGGEVVL